MSEELVVFFARFRQMVDQFLAAIPSSPLKVARGKSPQEQLALVEPTGVGRGEEHPHLFAVAPKKAAGILTDMTGTAIPDQMDPPGALEPAQQLAQGRAQMQAVVFVQAP